VDWNVYYFGAYAREELALLKEFLKEMDAPVVFDVGANVGHHTLFAAARCEKVYAFEPFEGVYRVLLTHLDCNDVRNVELCPHGLGDRNCREPFSPPPSRNLGMGSFARDHGESHSVQLDIRRGDDVVEEHDITKVSFIKVDTEGYTPQVFRGLARTLDRCRPVVFFEWSACDAQGLPGGEERQLLPQGYAFYHFRPNPARYGVFARPGYVLQELQGAWQMGNLLAVPEEFRNRLLQDAPSSEAARRLRASASQRGIAKGTH
jgi:FkbM family methyltransferase